MAACNFRPRLSHAAGCAVLAGTLLWFAGAYAVPSGQPPAREIPITGAIGPATADYVADELHAAAQTKAPLVILRLDTPGGLSSAMRSIIKAILASPVPVIGYVAPSGARAASAGTYILYATNIAAMAPATNVGAATPVMLGPGSHQNDKNNPNANAEHHKVVNDAVAYIRGLAEKRGRNAAWAEKAVRKAVSITAKTALSKHVIDTIAPNEAVLLATINGETVTTAAGPQTLHTQGLKIEHRTPGWRTQLLAFITDPTVAYLLFIVGVFGLVMEAFNPGATLPGLIGGASLFGALFAFHLLPVNYFGLALMVLGVALIIGEAFAPSFGALGIGGIAAFVFGSIMLINTRAPGFQVAPGVIGGVAAGAAILLLLIVLLFVHARRQRVHTGAQGLIGSECVALEDFTEQGRVHLHGESWLAVTTTPVRRGDVLVVTAAQGLKVHVRSKYADDPSSTKTT